MELKLKTTSSGGASRITLAHPGALIGEPLGVGRGVAIDRITDIPDGTPAEQVIKAWSETTNLTWIGRHKEDARHVFAWYEIGGGKIIQPERGSYAEFIQSR